MIVNASRLPLYKKTNSEMDTVPFDDARRRNGFEDAMAYQYCEPDKEDVVCKYFGCGKKLSMTEQLFGSRCQDHSKSIPQADPSDFISD